jgi:hypothetical protein
LIGHLKYAVAAAPCVTRHKLAIEGAPVRSAC